MSTCLIKMIVKQGASVGGSCKFHKKSCERQSIHKTNTGMIVSPFMRNSPNYI